MANEPKKELTTTEPTDTRFKVLFSSDVIAKRIEELGAAITKHYKSFPEPILVIGVLHGGFIFLADLVRALFPALNIEVAFVSLSSYANEVTSQGHVTLRSELSHNPENRHVLIVDDLIDTGLSLRWLREHLLSKKAASVSVCVCLKKVGDAAEKGVETKKEETKNEAQTEKETATETATEFVGFMVHGNPFVVGYGMDYAGLYRGLKHIAVLNRTQHEALAV